jgi:hypothetical protein
MPTPEQFTKERRKQPRHPIEAQVTALFSEFWTMGDMNALSGWTHNVSEGGVCFSLPSRISDTQLVLYLDYEGMGTEYVLATVVEVLDCQDGYWQYHCRIERMLTAISPFDLIHETMMEPAEPSAV